MILRFLWFLCFVVYSAITAAVAFSIFNKIGLHKNRVEIFNSILAIIYCVSSFMLACAYFL